MKMRLDAIKATLAAKMPILEIMLGNSKLKQEIAQDQLSISKWNKSGILCETCSKHVKKENPERKQTIPSKLLLCH